MAPEAPFSLWFPAIMLALIVGMYLTVETYIKTYDLTAAFATTSFYLLWIIHWFLSLLAFGAVDVTLGENLRAVFGHPELAWLAQVLIAAVSTLTVLQSLTLKMADYNILDLGQLMERLRERVYEAIGATAKRLKKRADYRLIDQISKKFGNRLEDLRDILALCLTAATLSPPEIQARLDEVIASAETGGPRVAFGYAKSLVEVDRDRAEQIVKAKG